MGFAKATVSGWENENSKPDIKTIKLIARTFNISFDEILDKYVL